MLRWLTSIASPTGVRSRLLTFYFHRVLPEPDPMQPGEPHAESFDRMLAWITSQFNVLRPAEACELLRLGGLPERAAMLSFDDGYRDNHDVAAPILKRRGVFAAFFVATGFLGEGMQFNDRVREALREAKSEALDASWLGLGVLDTSTITAKLAALDSLLSRIKYMLPAERLDAVLRIEEACRFSMQEYVRRDRPMMTDHEVRELAKAGMEIGGHTRNHPILRLLDGGAARAEIDQGYADLREITGASPILFAYPNGKLGGDFDREHCALVQRAGFRFAFTTHRGAATSSTDHYLLPRYMPWQRSSLRFRAQALRTVISGDLTPTGTPPRDGHSIGRPVA